MMRKAFGDTVGTVSSVRDDGVRTASVATS